MKQRSTTPVRNHAAWVSVGGISISSEPGLGLQTPSSAVQAVWCRWGGGALHPAAIDEGGGALAGVGSMAGSNVSPKTAHRCGGASADTVLRRR